MNKTLPALFITSLSILIISCTDNQINVGSVKNSITKVPIDSVLVEIEGSEETTYTDSLGNYFITKESGHTIPDSPTLDIRFSKEGYLPIRKINPNPTEIIYLTPNK